MFKQLTSTILTAAAGQTSKEAVAGGSFSLIVTTITAHLGGWDAALQILIYAMIFDYATGVLAGIKQKKLDSDIMLWGGVRKVVVLGVIALCVLLDSFLGNDSPIFRTLALYFYIGREGLSIIENLGKLDVLVPESVKSRLEQLKGNGEKSQ